METLYFVDEQGNYLGGFCGAEPHEGAVQISSPPEHAADKYIDGSWQVNPIRIIDGLKSELSTMEREAIMPRGAREAFIALCLQQGATAGKTEAQLYAANPFYKGLKDINVIATAKRAQIRALES